MFLEDIMLIFKQKLVRDHNDKYEFAINSTVVSSYQSSNLGEKN